MSATSVSTAASLSERASASNQQCSATTFVPPTPPAIVPTLAVVSSSLRPCGMSAVPRAAGAGGPAPAPGDGPDVGRGLLVEAPVRHVGDAPGGGDDRAAPGLGADAGVGGSAA